MTIDRRMMLTGMSALLVAPVMARAQAKPRLFAGGPLADNRLAAGFEAADLPLPKVDVIGANGRQRLDKLQGKTLIVALWAEWCAPCLVEARDLAALRTRYASDRFDFVSVLTASIGKLDLAGARGALRKVNADTLPLLIEPNGGDRIGRALSPGPGGLGARLPCTLLVDADGRIRGVAHGAPAEAPIGANRGPNTGPRILTDADKKAMIAGGRTAWASPAGEAFVKALHDGLALR